MRKIYVCKGGGESYFSYFMLSIHSYFAICNESMKLYKKVYIVHKTKMFYCLDYMILKEILATGVKLSRK